MLLPFLHIENFEKPNSDESIIFCVDMTTEHDEESHKTENIRIMAQKGIDIAKDIILELGGSSNMI